MKKRLKIKRLLKSILIILGILSCILILVKIIHLKKVQIEHEEFINYIRKESIKQTFNEDITNGIPSLNDGKTRGVHVKTLLSRVKDSNTFYKHINIIIVEFNNNVINDIEKLRSEINNNDFYNIEFMYSDKGNICQININETT